MLTSGHACQNRTSKVASEDFSRTEAKRRIKPVTSSGHTPILSSSSHTLPESFFLSVVEENDNFEECECVKRMGASKKPLYARQLPIIFTPSHTCAVSFCLLVGEENDNIDECACVKRMETQDTDKRDGTRSEATQQGTTALCDWRIQLLRSSMGQSSNAERLDKPLQVECRREQFGTVFEGHLV